jgi:hypothetical protein
VTRLAALIKQFLTAPIAIGADKKHHEKATW